MNITYEWKITGLKMAPSLDGLTDVVTGINFNYTGTDADSGESHTFPGAVPTSMPDSGSFTPFNELTEAEVITWAQANHPTAHMNEQIEKAILEKITPTNVQADLPWGTGSLSDPSPV
jgi:hypothetical protein